MKEVNNTANFYKCHQRNFPFLLVVRLPAFGNTDALNKRTSAVTLQARVSAGLCLTACRLCWCLAASWSAVRVWSTYRQELGTGVDFFFLEPKLRKRGAISHSLTCLNCTVLDYTFTAQWSLYVPPGLTPAKSMSCPHSVFMCLVWI